MSINSILFQSAAIGDYLFLILIVVASIIQSITQNKKKKALREITQEKDGQINSSIPEVLGSKPETMKGYETPTDSIFDSIQKMLNPSFEDEKHVWGDDYPQTEEEKKNMKEQEDLSKNVKVELVHDIEERPTELIASKPINENQAIRYKSKIRDGFSLRKAVVYSEILNRKYT
jgi:hypothetical protein